MQLILYTFYIHVFQFIYMYSNGHTIQHAIAQDMLEDCTLLIAQDMLEDCTLLIAQDMLEDSTLLYTFWSNACSYSPYKLLCIFIFHVHQFTCIINVNTSRFKTSLFVWNTSILSIQVQFVIITVKLLLSRKNFVYS